MSPVGKYVTHGSPPPPGPGIIDRRNRSMPIPKLRPLDLVETEWNGQQVVCARDYEGLLDQPVLLPLPVVLVALLLDGRRDLRDVQVAYARLTGGDLLPSWDLERIIHDLDAHGLLESPALEARARHGPRRHDLSGRPRAAAEHAGPAPGRRGPPGGPASRDPRAPHRLPAGWAHLRARLQAPRGAPAGDPRRRRGRRPRLAACALRPHAQGVRDPLRRGGGGRGAPRGRGVPLPLRPLRPR